MARLVQRAGKWFSSSLAPGIDVVADITDRLPSDTPYYHDRARCRAPSYFQPHGGPITHSSTGLKPDSPVHPLFPNLFLARGLICNSWTTVLLIYTGIKQNTYSDCFEPPFTLCFRHRTIAYPLENSHGTYLLCSRYCLKFPFESYYPPPSLMLSTR